MTKVTFSHWKTLLHIILLTLACAIVYWPTLNIQFNTKAWDYGLKLLYYCTPAILALSLSVYLWLFFDKLKVFVQNLLFSLSCIYIISSIQIVLMPSCEVQKNPDFFYASIISLLCSVSAYILFFKIRPKVLQANLLIITIALGLFLIDTFFFWFGYRLFWVSIWG
jgi:hypothetical protein